jgi:hypothetical protein
MGALGGLGAGEEEDGGEGWSYCEEKYEQGEAKQEKKAHLVQNLENPPRNPLSCLRPLDRQPLQSLNINLDLLLLRKQRSIRVPPPALDGFAEDSTVLVAESGEEGDGDGFGSVFGGGGGLRGGRRRRRGRARLVRGERRGEESVKGGGSVGELTGEEGDFEGLSRSHL